MDANTNGDVSVSSVTLTPGDLRLTLGAPGLYKDYTFRGHFYSSLLHGGHTFKNTYIGGGMGREGIQL